ncbi:metallophosphoesterase [Pseudogemmobacter sonorensis]|uniref:metallophosphoesterase n=1 Tax=Pseudogemmobacter sonorensis TaxID=2989681 RepID=UPI0036B69C36
MSGPGHPPVPGGQTNPWRRLLWKRFFGSPLLGRRLFGRGGEGVALAPLDPDAGPVYAVGDIHGCRSLLAGLEEVIRADAAAFPGRPRIVLLGDMIDRGPDVAGLIDDILRPLPWGERLAIRGNHEAMMLAFLADPQRRGDWLTHGGYETLRSYGLALDPAGLARLSGRRLGQMLAAHLPESHLAWLRALPHGFFLPMAETTWVLAHAGQDPARVLADQPPDVLIWGQPPGQTSGRTEGHGQGTPPRRLVHGHVIRDEVDLSAQDIGVDTGAWRTGRLSALRLVPGHPAQLLVQAGAAVPSALGPPIVSTGISAQ